MEIKRKRRNTISEWVFDHHKILIIIEAYTFLEVKLFWKQRLGNNHRVESKV